MRSGLLTTALLALVLQGCGEGSTTDGKGASVPPSAPQQQAVSAGDSPAAAAPASKPAASAAGAATQGTAPIAGGTARFTRAAAEGGRAPAVVLVGGGADEGSEARALAKVGIASLTLDGPPTAKAIRSALAQLRGRSDVDPLRLGLVGLGASAGPVAQALRREPSLAAVVLANPGAAATEPVSHLSGPVLVQHGGPAASGTADLKALLSAAPPGSVAMQYRQLDGRAQADRDRWLRGALAS